MDCKSVKEKLVDYLLGELDQKDALAMSEHLIDCAGCAREAKVLEQLLETMHDDHKCTPRGGVYERIRAATGMERTVPVLSFLRKPIRCYHAVAALLLGIIITLLSSALLEQRSRPVETINTPQETIRAPSTAGDSITFYTAPSYRLVSR